MAPTTITNSRTALAADRRALAKIVTEAAEADLGHEWQLGIAYEARNQDWITEEEKSARAARAAFTRAVDALHAFDAAHPGLVDGPINE
jgi:hypothetical protein